MPEISRIPDELLGQIVFDLQGSVVETKSSVASLSRRVDEGFARVEDRFARVDESIARVEERLARADGVLPRLEAVERTTAEIKDILRALTPKVDDLVGFARHRAPDLADKAALVKIEAELRAEIQARPTRRQAIFDIGWVVGLIAAAVTLGTRLAH
nr:hypothetical protein [uncultured Rhodopila sp.]